MEPFPTPSTERPVEPPSPYTGWRYRLAAGLGWVFAVVGLLGTVLTLWLGWQTRQVVARGARAQGIIVDFIYYPPDRHTTHGLYRPIFTFADTGGKTWRVSAQNSDYPAAYKRGDKVAVIYPAADPAAARIHTTGEIWGKVIVLGTISGFLMVMGALIVWWEGMNKDRATGTDLRWWDRWFVPIKTLLWWLR